MVSIVGVKLKLSIVTRSPPAGALAVGPFGGAGAAVGALVGWAGAGAGVAAAPEAVARWPHAESRISALMLHAHSTESGKRRFRDLRIMLLSDLIQLPSAITTMDLGRIFPVFGSRCQKE